MTALALNVIGPALIRGRQALSLAANDFPAPRGLETTANSAFTRNDATTLHSAMIT